MKRKKSDIELSGKSDKIKTPPFNFYDFLDIRGSEKNRVNAIKEFRLSLQKKHWARLKQKLDMLWNSDYGHHPGINELPPNLLTDTRNPHIKEIRINCDVAIRLMLCRGPLNMENEATFLAGGYERDSRYIPPNLLDISDHRRTIILGDPTRRVIHEQIG